MVKPQPLVSIGLPTYSRASLIPKAIDSILNQDYRNVEVVISDNASTDDTESVCRAIAERDPRVKYLRQATHIGAMPNFRSVLERASGEFFMWFSDDDWLDPQFISTCVRELTADPGVAVVSGTPRYYRGDKPARVGRIHNLVQESGWRRVFKYWLRMRDNGIFYGLMRIDQVRQFPLEDVWGSDCFFIAAIIFLGKARVFPEMSVHRGLGATPTYAKQVSRYRAFPWYQTVFSRSWMAYRAFRDIAGAHPPYVTAGPLKRLAVATAVATVILVRGAIRAPARIAGKLFALLRRR